jgi:pimeloyl-ACP methyl ester carboxylesterase
MARLGELFDKVDTYDPLPIPHEGFGFDQRIYDGIWPEAELLRSSGELLQMAGTITCPLVAIHGYYDPHPAEGVRGPLSRTTPDFRFYLLEKCGHTPWRERHARDWFFAILKKEII